MSSYSQYWKKNNDIEMYFKKYVRKLRLEDVLVTLASLGKFFQNTVNIKTCSACSILVNETENKDVPIDT